MQTRAIFAASYSLMQLTFNAITTSALYSLLFTRTAAFENKNSLFMTNYDFISQNVPFFDAQYVLFLFDETQQAHFNFYKTFINAVETQNNILLFPDLPAHKKFPCNTLFLNGTTFVLSEPTADSILMPYTFDTHFKCNGWDNPMLAQHFKKYLHTQMLTTELKTLLTELKLLVHEIAGQWGFYVQEFHLNPKNITQEQQAAVQICKNLSVRLKELLQSDMLKKIYSAQTIANRCHELDTIFRSYPHYENLHDSLDYVYQFSERIFSELSEVYAQQMQKLETMDTTFITQRDSQMLRALHSYKKGKANIFALFSQSYALTSENKLRPSIAEGLTDLTHVVLMPRK